MLKQLSSLDLHFLLKELKILEGCRVDKIFNFGKEEIYIQFYKSNHGKIILKILNGKSMFIAKEKQSDESPSHLCMMMRKNLEGKSLDSIKQLEPERIVRLDFKSKDSEKKVYIEIFAKGNVILCDDKDVIVDALLKHRFRDRTILPKQTYKHPNLKYNLFNLQEKDIIDLFKDTKKDKIVASLATELGLGGIYSEEVCLLSNLDKGKDTKKINHEEISLISKSIKKIINKKSNPQIILKDKKIVDAIPVKADLYENYDKKDFDDFNKALEYYFEKELQLIRKESSSYVKKLNELNRIIAEQKETLGSIKEKETEIRKKAEIIYANYQLISDVLLEINKAKEKHSWEGIKKKLKGHKVIKELDIKEKKIVVDV